MNFLLLFDHSVRPQIAALCGRSPALSRVSIFQAQFPRLADCVIAAAQAKKTMHLSPHWRVGRHFSH
jgi:hypothetical protein